MLDIIFSGYNVNPNRVSFYFVQNISHFVHISPPAEYRGKSGVERSGRRMGDCKMYEIKPIEFPLIFKYSWLLLVSPYLDQL